MSEWNMNENIDAKYRIHLNDDDGGTGSISDDLEFTASEIAQARAGKGRNLYAYVLAVCDNDDTVENEFVFPTMPDMREFANEYGFHIVDEEWKYDVPFVARLDEDYRWSGAAPEVDVLVDLHVSYAVDRSTGGWTF